MLNLSCSGPEVKACNNNYNTHSFSIGQMLMYMGGHVVRVFLIYMLVSKWYLVYDHGLLKRIASVVLMHITHYKDENRLG